MSAESLIRDAVMHQTLEAMWDEFRDSCIAPEVPADEVQRQRESFMAGALGILQLEHASRRIKRQEQLESFDRLREEGKFIGSQIVNTHIATLEAARSPKQ